jgi:hypothetical protein
VARGPLLESWSPACHRLSDSRPSGRRAAYALSALPVSVDLSDVAEPQTTITLPPRVNMAELNFCLADAHEGTGGLVPRLLIDLEAVEFILVECLATIIAEVGQRQRAALGTVIRLPLSRDVRGFLRDWGFAPTFRKTTGVSLMAMVERRNLLKINELDSRASGREPHRYGYDKVYQTQSGPLRVPVDMHRYFGFRHWQPIDIPGDPLRFKRVVIDECNRWVQDPVVTGVLKAQLGEFYNYVSGAIIHEALSNAFRHGGASSVLMVTKGEPRPGSRFNRFLTLVFWDNGRPSYETLRSRLDQGAEIKGSAYADNPHLAFKVKAPFEGGLVGQRTYTSDVPPQVSAENWELFLSTLYPGITCDPSGLSHFDMSVPGRGLPNLINGAVDVLGGSVAFRSGEYFMNVKPFGKRPQITQLDGGGIGSAPIAPRYSVKVDHSWKFFGNMVTVRLPIRA